MDGWRGVGSIVFKRSRHVAQAMKYLVEYWGAAWDVVEGREGGRGESLGQRQGDVC